MPGVRFPHDEILVSGPTVYAPPYPDLVAGSIFVRVNHTNQRICVGALIRNEGGGPPGRPWQLAIGITFVKAGVTISSQELFTISQNQVIGWGGFESPCSEAELVYRDEDAGAVYTLEALVDVNHELVDLDRSNNYREGKTWWVNPSAVAKKRRVRFDMSGERPSVVDSEAMD